MNSLACGVPCTLTPARRVAPDRLIRERVRLVFQLYQQRPPLPDRRRDRREPFPFPIYVTPVADTGLTPIAATFVVLGKHLSERGLDFYYQAPLPYRRVITSWEGDGGQWLALLLDLRWCRSNRHGWYENGGRFLQVVDSPLGSIDPIATQRPSAEQHR